MLKSLHQDVPFEQLVSLRQQHHSEIRNIRRYFRHYLIWFTTNKTRTDPIPTRVQSPHLQRKSLSLNSALSLDIVAHKEALVVCFEHAADRFITSLSPKVSLTGLPVIAACTTDITPTQCTISRFRTYQTQTQQIR